MADEVKKETQTAEAPKEPTLDELKAEIANLKKAISASNADASKRKKEAEEWQGKYKATLDEQTKQKLEAEQASKAIAEELAAYKAKERIASYTAKLMASGFDSKSAADMASVLPESVPDSFFDSQKAFVEALKQEQKTQKINSQPTLPAGTAHRHDGRDGPVNLLGSSRLREFLVSGCVLFHSDIREIPPQDRVSAMLQATREDCALELLDRPGHGREALAKLGDGDPGSREAGRYRRAVPSVDRDFHHAIARRHVGDRGDDGVMVDDVARRSSQEALLGPVEIGELVALLALSQRGRAHSTCCRAMARPLPR